MCRWTNKVRRGMYCCKIKKMKNISINQFFEKKSKRRKTPETLDPKSRTLCSWNCATVTAISSAVRCWAPSCRNRRIPSVTSFMARETGSSTNSSPVRSKSALLGIHDTITDLLDRHGHVSVLTQNNFGHFKKRFSQPPRIRSRRTTSTMGVSHICCTVRTSTRFFKLAR